MVHVRIARDENDVRLVPAQATHFLPSRRQKLFRVVQLRHSGILLYHERENADRTNATFYSGTISNARCCNRYGEVIRNVLRRCIESTRMR